MKKCTEDYEFTKPRASSLSSMSDSCSNYIKKTNWKRLMPQDGNLFYTKHIQENDSPHNEMQNIGKLLSVKNDNIKEICLVVNSLDRYRFGRRSSIVESMLGFQVTPFPDNAECLMVTNIIDNSIKIEHPYMKEGDWFKSLDDIEVRTGNIDKLLLQYTRATKVKLILIGTSNEKRRDGERFCETFNFDDFAYVYKNAFGNNTFQEDINPSFLTLIINQEYFKTDSSKESIFYYPFSPNNFLNKAKGSFLTLDSVIKNDLMSKALQSTIVVKDVKYFVIYGHINSSLVVCAFASHYVNSKTAFSISNDFTNFIKFSITEFESQEIRQYLAHVCDILRISVEQNIDSSTNNLQFGALLNASTCIALPKEAQLRISDALSELESMDYMKGSELDETSRSFIVYGSALYYNQYLVSSSLPVDFRKNVECFLRFHGISEFVLRKNVSEMYIWKELLQWHARNTYYLAICVHKNVLLAVVLRSTVPQVTSKSCILCMDEIKDTLDYLISCGIDSVTQVWIDSNKRPHMNLNKTSNDRGQKSKFMFSSENVEASHLLCDSPSGSLQNEERSRKRSEGDNAYDWQSFSNQTEPNEDQIEPLLGEIKHMMPLNMSTGWSNNLKFFLHFNISDAGIIQPFKSVLTDVRMRTIKDLILVIHDVLQINQNLKMLQDTPTSLNKSLIVVKEHGITVDVGNQTNKESVTIIGRLFSFPLREVYVCFDQNASQNLIELAFRMPFLNIG